MTAMILINQNQDSHEGRKKAEKYILGARKA